MRKAIHSDEQRRLAELLRSLRESAGLRQVDLADQLGVAQSAVSKWETGQRRLDLVELDQICEALGTTLPKIVARLRRP